MRFLTFAVLASTAALAAAVQQGSTSPQTSSPSRPQTTPQMTDRAGPSDAFLASWLLAGNNNEIAVSELAAQKASDPEVKRFAEKMIDDHREMGRKLQSYALGGDSMGRSDVEDQRGRPVAATQRGDDLDRPQTGTQEAGYSRDLDGQVPLASVGDVQHIALIRDLEEQCLETARRELGMKQGAEFDRCYMMGAVMAHTKTNDMLTVFQQHASASLKPALSEAQNKVAAHLQHAKDISKRLEGGSMGGTTREPATTTKPDDDDGDY
jgi:predicted outer membrane protein